jgi:hypothetical protein
MSRGMNRTVASFMGFFMALALLVGVLALLNRVPGLFQKDLMRRYRDIEEVRARLSIPEIYVPSYYPQDLGWPPSTIMAQGRPFPALVMEFSRAGTGDTVLVVSQAASESFVFDEKIGIARIKEQARHSLKGRDAILSVGVGKKGEPCSRISWREGRYRVVVTARSTPLELIEVAGSMIP